MPAPTLFRANRSRANAKMSRVTAKMSRGVKGVGHMQRRNGKRRGSRETAPPKRRRAAGEVGCAAVEPGGATAAGTASASASPLAAVEAAFADVDGYAIARRATREQRAAGTFLPGLQYGEIRPRAFATALEWLDPRYGESFVDLGSGTGKATLTAAALHSFASATGVEIQEALHGAALAALRRCGPLRTPSVRFLHADALEHPWHEADVVYVNAACFTDEMVRRIEVGASRLRRGARLLITTRALDCAALRLLRRDALPCAKGALLFIAYERV